MDRTSGELKRSTEAAADEGRAAIRLTDAAEYLVEPKSPPAEAERTGIDPALFDLAELEVTYEPEHATLWTMMRPAGRPSFTLPMLDDFAAWQRLIASSFGAERAALRYLVLGSNAPDVFCFGGDLQLFQQLIRDGDRPGLVRYGFSCVEILHCNMLSLGLPILTIGLAQGAALGGGFESLLSFDYIVAEEHATFGLPETLFGLFPGMGAHSFLSRKLGSAMANRLIVSNKTYTAQEMFDLGIVHHVAESGKGMEACRDFIRKLERRHFGLVNSSKAMKVTNPVTLRELKEIVELWADAALQLSEADLKIMNRLTRAQQKLTGAV